MSSAKETVARNASVLLISQVITWLLTLLLTIFLPRYLGAEAVGQIHIAESLWGILAVVATFGMDFVVTKQIAREPQTAPRFLSNSLVLRLLLFLVVTALLAVMLRFANYPPTTVDVIIIIGFSQFLWQIIGAFWAALRGVERMEYISLGNVAGKVLYTTAGIALLLLGYGVLFIAAASVAAALVTLLVQGFFLRRFVPLRPALDRETAAWMLRAAVPYFLQAIFLVVYMQLDVVIISLLVNETVVGWYSAADRLFGTLLFLPTVFTTAVFPALARIYDSDRERMPQLVERSFLLLLLISLPLGLGIVVVAHPIVLLLFGAQFEPSGIVLAIMGIVLIFTYQNMLLGHFFISMDRQRTWTKIMAAATVATLPIDLVLIPWFQNNMGNGAIGGAIAFVITEAGILVAALVLLPHNIVTRRNLWKAGRISLAALAMTWVAWALRDAFIAVPIVAGAVVYLVLLWLLKMLPRDELVLVRDLARQLWQRLTPGPATG